MRVGHDWQFTLKEVPTLGLFSGFTVYFQNITVANWHFSLPKKWTLAFYGVKFGVGRFVCILRVALQ